MTANLNGWNKSEEWGVGRWIRTEDGLTASLTTPTSEPGSTQFWEESSVSPPILWRKLQGPHMWYSKVEARGGQSSQTISKLWE